MDADCALCGKGFKTIDHRRFCTVGCEVGWWSGNEALEENAKLRAELETVRMVARNIQAERDELEKELAKVREILDATRRGHEGVSVERDASLKRALATSEPKVDGSPVTVNHGDWRVGRKVGRTVYRDEVLIGVMDTREYAALVVHAVNGMARQTPAPSSSDAPQGQDERNR